METNILRRVFSVRVMVMVCVMMMLCGRVDASCRGASRKYTPVVLMHGISDVAASMDPLAGWIRDAYGADHIYVKSVEVGNGAHDSNYMPVNQQIELFHQAVVNDTELACGFNLLGYSQGGIITRGYIERFNSPRVFHYVTLGSPHGGQFGIPFTGIEWLDRLVSTAAYTDYVQNHLAPSNYWRDSYRLDQYEEKALTLPDLNNVRTGTPLNEAYRKNIESLLSFTLVYSINDQIIKPPQSGWFGTYAPNSFDVLPLQNQSDLWDENRIGLRTLSEQGRLRFLQGTCRHEDYPRQPNLPFLQEHVIPIFNTTVSACHSSSPCLSKNTF